MPDVIENQPRYIDDSLGQLRLLRIKLSDSLRKLIIATILCGGIFFGTASGRGTTSMEVVSGITGSVFFIFLTAILTRFLTKRSRILAKSRAHSQK